MTDVLLLWHMHQPKYTHPETGRPVLPWVRLHAASGYLDMARALERRPGVRVTVNFVPSLVEQLEALAAGEKDDLERIAEKPADALDEAEVRLVVERSFSVRWDRGIDPRPRYAELLARRGAGRFTARELRDLECLFLLAWLGFAAREDDPAIDALDAKGRDFSEGDKAELLRAVRRAATGVLDAWRRLAARGQIELSTSPYYHPIVPLLIDTHVAKRSRPSDELPPRFSRPEDARAQIELAAAAHRRAFGEPAKGMWPPEGALSPEAVALYGACGVKWLAGDEETLTRSLPAPDARAKARLWRHAGVTLAFRDRDLSDRIGFRYAGQPAEAAADDLLQGARASASGDGVACIFLDGENAWEAYPRRGEAFLDALYARLESPPRGLEVRSRTLSEAIAERGPGTPLETLHSGSWIDGSFRIWIGDPIKNRAWTELRRARDRVAAATGPGAQRALRLLYAAEGSDWFWWFGEPFSSAEDPVFDALFREHLAAAWRAVGDEPPAELAEPITPEAATTSLITPRALVRPHIDGKGDRFYEWVGAARYELGRGATMAQAEPPPIRRVLLGFDERMLYLRLDPNPVDRRRVAASRLVLRMRCGPREVRLPVQLGAADGGPELRRAGGRVGALDVVELAIPFAVVDAKERDPVSLWMTLELFGVVYARIPLDGVFTVTVPWPGWEDEHWSV